MDTLTRTAALHHNDSLGNIALAFTAPGPGPAATATGSASSAVAEPVCYHWQWEGGHPNHVLCSDDAISDFSGAALYTSRAILSYMI